MSGIDDILSYKKNPDEDFYALLNCNENSSVRTLVDQTNLYRANCGEFPSDSRKFRFESQRYVAHYFDSRFVVAKTNEGRQCYTASST